jgi:chorismate mutase
MKLWMRERDQLIEQTLAFVEGVAAAKPARAAAVGPALAEPKPVAQAEPADSSKPEKFVAMRLPPVASERAEIERRVAKFKAQQQKFQRAREAHYDAIFSQARATPGNQTRL